MNDKEYRKQKKRVKKLIQYYKAKLGLHLWRINTQYHREYPDSSHHPSNCVMWVTADWRYMDGTIHVVLPAIENFSDEDLEYFVLHEYAHIILNEMHVDDEMFQDHEEHVATMLGLTWQWLHNQERGV